jgi:predicted house-cleaning noncanonical NTP pyrophosphatase (MazG superfamily)
MDKNVYKVVYAIANTKGKGDIILNKIREEKCQKRGGFNKRLFLIKTEEDINEEI